MSPSFALQILLIATLVLGACRGGSGEPEASAPTAEAPSPSEGTAAAPAATGQADLAGALDAAPAPGPDSGMPVAPRLTNDDLPRPNVQRSARASILEIAELLSRADVREVTGYTGPLEESVLEGQEASANYNSVRFATEQTLGVGLQVWDLASSAATNRQFLRFRDTYIEVRATRTVGDSGFRADFGGVRQLVFMSRRRSTIVALACDETVCPTDAEIEAIAERVESRL